MRRAPSSDEKLDAVIRGARAILEQKSFAEAARSIFDMCCATTGTTSGYVALLSDDGAENEVLFLEAGGLPCTVDPALPMPIRGLRSTAYETQKAVADNDFMDSEWVQYMPEGHVVLDNVMFAPLNLEGKTVGIMGLANKPSDFTSDDLEIAAAFGELAAIALSNSRYLDRLNEKNAALEKALSEIKTLRSILPICSNCKKVCDDAGNWSKLESHVMRHTSTHFSHGLCPTCLSELFPDDAQSIMEDIESLQTKGSNQP